MPRSSGKRSGGGKKGKGKGSSKEPKQKKEAAKTRPLDLPQLQAANDLCLKLINGAVVLVGVALAAVAMSASSSGGGASAWTLGLYIAAAGLFVSGLLGQWVAHTGFKEVDVVTKVYFVLMVSMTMLMLWLSLFMTFNLNEVKWLVKGWIYMNWAEFWASLPESDQGMLENTGGCSADGHAMSDLDDDCWEALKQYIFRSWKVGGLLVVVMVVLLPFNIFFAGTKIGWSEAMDAVQSVISFISIGNGVLFVILAFQPVVVSTQAIHQLLEMCRPSLTDCLWPQNGMMSVVCVLIGLFVIALAFVQLVPNLFVERFGPDFEAEAGACSKSCSISRRFFWRFSRRLIFRLA